MPNTNNPNGFTAIGRGITGGPVSTREYTKPASDSVAIFPGDALYAVTGGAVKAGRDNAAPFVGVALDFGKASTATKHLVIASPDQLYECQCSGAFVAANLGKNANIVATAGDVVRKRSKHEVDSATIATTGTLDVQLHALVEDPWNSFGANARVEVRFNRHFLNLGRTGI